MRSSIGKWCGPTALAVVAGLDYDAAVERLKRRKRARRPTLRRIVLAATNVADLGAELELLGADKMETGGRVPLWRWLDSYHEPDRFTVVWVTGHFVTVYGATMVDNQKGATGLRERHQRKRVRGFWRLPY